jgi:hypothetical protein
MSLALYASPINNDEPINYGNGNGNGNGNGSEIDKKRNARKTIKNRPSSSYTNDHNNNNNNNNGNVNQNVQKMLKTIYEPANDDSGDIADFNPPPHAEPTKVPQMNYNSELLGNHNNNNNNNNSLVNSNFGQNEQLNNVNKKEKTDENVTIETFNNLQNNSAKDYYKQYVPYYNQMSQDSSSSKDQLLEKLNYMIHLLEEQQDIKTGHVMEEIILYSFLGIFMIFVVDSFARAAKYVR